MVLGCILIPSTPYFSDDYYRFFWDGYWFSQGYSVYAATPQELALYQDLPEQLKTVHAALNSPKYYAIYTPFNQVLYALPFWLGFSSIAGFVSVVRCLFLAIAIAGFFGLRASLSRLKLPAKNAWWLLGSPLLWMEGLANLHVEWCIVFLAMTSLPFLLHLKPQGFALASSAIALKISTFPFFLGLMLPKYSSRKWLILVLSFTGVIATSLLFIQPHEMSNLFQSVRLFAESFEFNGFFYPLVNGLVSSVLGYNAIAYTGKGLAVSAFVFIAILWLRYKRKNVSPKQNILFVQWASVAYLLCATTIHPWYLLLPLCTLPFVPNRFVLAWSLTVFISYWFYQDFRVQPWWWLLEYGIPLLYAGYPRAAYALGWNSSRVDRR